MFSASFLKDNGTLYMTRERKEGKKKQQPTTIQLVSFKREHGRVSKDTIKSHVWALGYVVRAVQIAWMSPIYQRVIST